MYTSNFIAAAVAVIALLQPTFASPTSLALSNSDIDAYASAHGLEVRQSRKNMCKKNEVGIGSRQTCLPRPGGSGGATDGGCGAEHAALWNVQCGGNTLAITPMSEKMCGKDYSKPWQVKCEKGNPIWLGDGLRTWGGCRKVSGRCEKVFGNAKTIDTIEYCCPFQSNGAPPLPPPKN